MHTHQIQKTQKTQRSCCSHYFQVLTITMPRRNIVVFGAAGAGKSSFLNNALKTHCPSGLTFPVSHQKSQDGTTSLRSYQTPNACFYDTVGLNSTNCSTCVDTLGLALRKSNVPTFVVLVCRKDEPRWTYWIDIFLAYMNSLFESSKTSPHQIAVYWSGSEEQSDSQEELQEFLQSKGTFMRLHQIHHASALDQLTFQPSALRPLPHHPNKVSLGKDKAIVSQPAPAPRGNMSPSSTSNTHLLVGISLLNNIPKLPGQNLLAKFNLETDD
jgi:hypothetical protein